MPACMSHVIFPSVLRFGEAFQGIQTLYNVLLCKQILSRFPTINRMLPACEYSPPQL